MSEIGETFKAYKEERQRKRRDNATSSIEMLKRMGVEFVVCNAAIPHLRVCKDIDFWPSTGTWRRRGATGRVVEGRGVRNLLREIECRERE